MGIMVKHLYLNHYIRMKIILIILIQLIIIFQFLIILINHMKNKLTFKVNFKLFIKNDNQLILSRKFYKKDLDLYSLY
jgi:hypothetical protein